VISVDGHPVGGGGVGKVTTELREPYAEVVHGERPEYADWCLEAC
jgi:hypothetical protein